MLDNENKSSLLTIHYQSNSGLQTGIFSDEKKI